MALQRVKLAPPQYLPITAGVLLENTNGTDNILVAGVLLFNGGASTETVKLYFVPGSAGAPGTAGASNQFMEIELTTKNSLFVEFPFPLVLDTDGDSLQGVTETASAVVAIVCGDKDV